MSKVIESNVMEVEVISAELMVQDSKEERAKLKRMANPQFANLQSRTRKVIDFVKKQSVQQLLIESKQTIKVSESINGIDNFENRAYLDKCVSAINYFCKNEDLQDLISMACRRSKSGLMSTYYVEQLVQKVVKNSIANGSTYKHELNLLVAAKKVKSLIA